MRATVRYRLDPPPPPGEPTLTDAVGERRTQNQPGTIDEYPNWRVPLGGPDGRPMWLEDVFTYRRAAALAEALRTATGPESG